MSRGRGRPALPSPFTPTVQKRYLDEITTGARLEDAASTVGVHRNVPARHARTDTAFAKAFEEAKARGREARRANGPTTPAATGTTAVTARTAARTTPPSGRTGGTGPTTGQPRGGSSTSAAAGILPLPFAAASVFWPSGLTCWHSLFSVQKLRTSVVDRTHVR